MRDFQTRSFPDLVARHHRPVATASGALRGRARHGRCAWIAHFGLGWVTLRALKVAVRMRPQRAVRRRLRLRLPARRGEAGAAGRGRGIPPLRPRASCAPGCGRPCPAGWRSDVRDRGDRRRRPSPRAAGAAGAAGDDRGDRAPRARRGRPLARARRGARHAPAQHHRPRRAASSRWPTRTARSAPSSTARSTTSASCATTLAAARPPLRHQRRRRDHRPPLRGARARLRPAPARHVRDRALGPPRRRLVLARDRMGVKPLYVAETSRGPGLRLRGQVADRRRPGRAAARPRSPPSCSWPTATCPARATLFAGVRKLPPASSLALRGRPHRRTADATGPPGTAPPSRPGPPGRRTASACSSCCARRRGHGWSATCRSA